MLLAGDWQRDCWLIFLARQTYPPGAEAGRRTVENGIRRILGPRLFDTHSRSASMGPPYARDREVDTLHVLAGGLVAPSQLEQPTAPALGARDAAALPDNDGREQIISRRERLRTSAAPACDEALEGGADAKSRSVDRIYAFEDVTEESLEAFCQIVCGIVSRLRVLEGLGYDETSARMETYLFGPPSEVALEAIHVVMGNVQDDVRVK